jgi:CRP-like cAMP-binding protein
VVIDAMDQQFFKPDDTVIAQGESGNDLFVVEEGSLACSKIFVSYADLT